MDTTAPLHSARSGRPLGSAPRCRRDSRLLERQAGDRLGHTWRLERKSIPRRIDRDFTHQGRPRLLCEGQDLVLIACPPLKRLTLAALGHGPGERAVRVELRRDGRLLVRFGRPWPCRFCGGAGGGGSSSAVRDSPSGPVRELSPTPAWARSIGFAAPVSPAFARCRGAWAAGEPWHRGGFAGSAFVLGFSLDRGFPGGFAGSALVWRLRGLSLCFFRGFSLCLRRVKVFNLQWVRLPPGTWVAPAVSYRSDPWRKRTRRSLRDRRVAIGGSASRQAVIASER